MEMPTQMVFYLGGEGGTGKSKVLLAFTKFLKSIHLRHALRITAPTGVAAGNVGGSTTSSLLKFGAGGQVLPCTDELRQNFKTASILFLDEVSMIGCSQLKKISKRLCGIKENKTAFGSMTVILAGDFYQLQPIGSCPLFRKPSVARGENYTQNLQGYKAFSMVTHVVFGIEGGSML
jgi:ATP-dependent DNA helicase PIF1